MSTLKEGRTSWGTMTSVPRTLMYMYDVHMLSTCRNDPMKLILLDWRVRSQQKCISGGVGVPGVLLRRRSAMFERPLNLRREYECQNWFLWSKRLTLLLSNRTSDSEVGHRHHSSAANKNKHLEVICVKTSSPLCERDRHHPNMSWVSFLQNISPPLWCKSEHLGFQCRAGSRVAPRGGGEPRSHRNMAAPAAPNDATAAPSRWPTPSADSAPHGSHRNGCTQVRLPRPSHADTRFNPSPSEIK